MLGLLLATTLALADYPQPPRIDVSELDGIYEAVMPGLVGIEGPNVKAVLDCGRGVCRFSIGETGRRYERPGRVSPALYARTKESLARRHPGAELRGCINMGGDKSPDGPFACRLEGMPGGKRAVWVVPPGAPGEEFTLYPRR